MPDFNLPPTIQDAAEKEQSDARQNLLDRFAEHPDDDAIWETGCSWVTTEGDTGPHSSTADDIPVNELIGLAQTVRATAPEDRYNLMANRASNGQRWFDVLQTFSSDQLAQVRKVVIGSWVNEGGSAGKFHRALDLGTGTGKSLEALEVNAESVVGLDRNQTLLNVASEVAGEHTTLVRGEVDRLPFDDASFDLVASSGISGALDKATATALYRELARVMATGGVYIEGSYLTRDGYSGEELARRIATSKAMLADMIVDTVSGKLGITDHLEGEDEQALLAELGLHAGYYDVIDKDGITHSLITVVTKTSHEVEESSALSQEIAIILSNLGEKYGFDPETVEEIGALPFEEAFAAAYNYLTQADLDAEDILAAYLGDPTDQSQS